MYTRYIYTSLKTLFFFSKCTSIDISQCENIARNWISPKSAKSSPKKIIGGILLHTIIKLKMDLKSASNSAFFYTYVPVLKKRFFYKLGMQQPMKCLKKLKTLLINVSHKV